MTKLDPYTYPDELFALGETQNLYEMTKKLRKYCRLVVNAAESGRISWHQAAYDITGTVRFELDDVPGYTDLIDAVAGDVEMYGPTNEAVEKIKNLVNCI